MNHLAMEPLLINRIKSAVPDFRVVLGVADLESVPGASQTVPAAHVIYNGDVIPSGSSAGHGSAQVVVQSWLVVILVRNARDALGGSATRSDAGLLLTDTIQALSGWQPAPEFRPLVRVNAPRPAFNAGFGYFPLAFEARFITKGAQQ